MEDKKLAAIAQRLGIWGVKARRRQESYLNSPIADMPFWDRVMIEGMMELEERMDKIEKDNASITEILQPASEHEDFQE